MTVVRFLARVCRSSWMPHILCGVIGVAAALPADAQEVEWATRVLSFTSQYDTADHAARQTLGPPNVLPLGGDRPGAWMAGERGADGRMYEPRTPQVLTLGYAHPIHVRQIAVAESWCPGAIATISLLDSSGTEHLVYVHEPQGIGTQGRMLHVYCDRTAYSVGVVRLVMRPAEIDGWNAIDAVAIADSRVPVQARITLPAGTVATGPPEHLPATVNSPNIDYVPVISPDGRTLYFARDVDSPADTTRGDVDIWVTTRDSSGAWTPARNVGPPLNNDGPNTIFSVTPDGNTVLLANTYTATGALAGDGYSLSYRTREGWSVPESLRIDDFYNRRGTGEACLSNTGETLLLTAERDSGLGGADIYVCFHKPDGSWTAPRNLGWDVNTPMDEISPFLAADDRTLYFATAGRAGYGKTDLFMTRRLDSTWTRWSEPVNLGPSINTPDFDAYYTIPAAGDYAYFSSWHNTYGKADIFRVRLPESVRPGPVMLVRGSVRNARTGRPVEAVICYETLSDGRPAGTAHTTPGTGNYEIVLPAGVDYGFRAEAPGYLSVNDHLDGSAITAYRELRRDLLLAPIEVGTTVRLNNIFFAFGSDSLEPTSFPELNRVAAFLRENALLHVRIDGHTDNVGSDERNLALSEGRAAAVTRYLAAHGVEGTRVTSAGHGSEEPVATNGTEEGRQLNRRVEFTIVE